MRLLTFNKFVVCCLLLVVRCFCYYLLPTANARKIKDRPRKYNATPNLASNIAQNHQKSSLGVAAEALGRRLGGILAPRAAEESKRETNLVSLTHLGSPKGPPLGPYFQDVS